MFVLIVQLRHQLHISKGFENRLVILQSQQLFLLKEFDTQVQIVGLPIDIKIERLIGIRVVHFIDTEGVLAELVFLWLSWSRLLLGCVLQDVVACDEVLYN